MHKILYIAFLSVLISSYTAFGKTDPEILESSKCSNMFSYFEKRYNIPKDTLHSISLRETQKAHSKHRIGIVWPWTITVNPTGKGYYFKSKSEAIKFAKAQLAKGKGSIDVGCMQINLKYHPDAFSSIEQAFSPRSNVAYGAKFLKEKYAQHGKWKSAIGSYHSSSPDKASAYHAMVSKTSSAMSSYKKNLARVSTPNYKKTKTLASSRSSTQKSKFLGMGKVQVRVGTLKENNWFRKVQ
jgi:hypothetical protein